MSTRTRFRLGTRRSPLAQWQANWVATQLRARGADVDVVFMQTRGDIETRPIGSLGGEVGVFTNTIQQGLLGGEIDLAVHSLKDLPTAGVEGLVLAAVPARESNRDALVSQEGVRLEDLPPASVVGTGSLRRQAQLLHLRPDLVMQDIRGNIDTRLRKLQEGPYAAIVLAEAGLKRLGLQDRITHGFAPSMVLPAVGQGALGIEIRAGDQHLAELVRNLDHPPSHSAVIAERTMLATLRGGCLAPVGAWGRVGDDQRLVLDAVVLSADGRQRLAASTSGPAERAADIGAEVGRELIDQGAAELIATLRKP